MSTSQKKKWDVLPLNRVIRMRSGDFIAANEVEADGEYPVYGGNGFRGFTTEFNTSGPIVLVGRQGAHCGNVHVVDGDIWVSEHALRCFPEKHLDARWLAYVLHHMNLNQYSVSAAQPGLSVDNLKHLRIAFPPLEIQRQIARFLGEKTARIDALIEKKRTLLERLAEKRQALITRAVTKGLNPDVPMKPSGIDWLGDIPAHWELVPLKRLGHVRSGVTKGKSYNNEETVVLPYLRVANVQDGWLDLDEIAEIEVRASDIEKYSLKDGDILMNEGGDNDKLGRGAIWRSQISPCLHQNHVFAVRLDSAEPEWVARCTETAYAKFHFFRRAVQSTNLASISRGVVEDLAIPLPPKAEILKILESLDSELSLVSKSIDKINQAISLYVEYRAALITTAVTGQLSLDTVPSELERQEA